jgi:hypothetical protein
MRNFGICFQQSSLLSHPGWDKHLACKGGMRDAHKIQIGKPDGESSLWRIDIIITIVRSALTKKAAHSSTRRYASVYKASRPYRTSSGQPPMLPRRPGFDPTVCTKFVLRKVPLDEVPPSPLFLFPPVSIIPSKLHTHISPSADAI